MSQTFLMSQLIKKQTKNPVTPGLHNANEIKMWVFFLLNTMLVSQGFHCFPWVVSDVKAKRCWQKGEI